MNLSSGAILGFKMLAFCNEGESFVREIYLILHTNFQAGFEPEASTTRYQSLIDIIPAPSLLLI